MAPRNLVSDEELLEDLRRVARIAPAFNTSDIKRHGRYAPRTYYIRFQSIEEMRRRIGWTSPEQVDRTALKGQLAQVAGWTEEECVAHFRAFRWPQEIACPRCDDPAAVVRIKTQSLTNPEIALFECRDCLYQFSDISGTVFHKSCTPMKEWFLVILTFFGAPDLHTDDRAALIGMTGHNYRYKIARIKGSKMSQELNAHLLSILQNQSKEPSHEQSNANKV